VTVTVTLSQAMTTAVSVTIATRAAGTGAGFATPGTDYTTATTTLTFKAGTTKLTFTIAIAGDRLVEGDEVFEVVLTNPTGGAAIGTGVAKVTIVDNDRALFATRAATSSGRIARALAPARARALLRVAIARWLRAGIRRSALRGVTVRVADLPGAQLAHVRGRTIVVDRDAAGWGWSARVGRPAVGRMDLLTVLAHELGHVLGHEHADGPGDVMTGTLAAGVRLRRRPRRRTPPPDLAETRRR
jgi:hypothetical protein